MRKWEIVLFVILLLIGSGIIIFKLFNDKGDVGVFTTTTKMPETKEGYTLSDSSSIYKEYTINKDDLSKFNVVIEDNKISVSDGLLYINETSIDERIKIYRKVFIYDNLLIIGVNYDEYLYDGLVIYDMISSKIKVVNQLNSLYLDLTNNFSATDSGLVLDVSIIFGDKVITDKGDLDVCKVSKNMFKTARASLLYLYNREVSNFLDYEEVSSISFESYVYSNNLCK